MKGERIHLNLNKNYMTISILVSVFIPFLIPSIFFIEGMGRYKFGFPISYITIFQNEPGSMWLGANFFTGNAGLSINPLSFLLNIIIIYFIIQFITKKAENRRKLLTMEKGV